MVGGYERVAVPGGALRDKTRRRRGSWMRGESRRALACCLQVYEIVEILLRLAVPAFLATHPQQENRLAPHLATIAVSQLAKPDKKEGLEEPKGPELKRRPRLPARAGPYGSPSRRPQGCQGSAAHAPSHQLHRHQLALAVLVEQRRPAPRADVG